MKNIKGITLISLVISIIIMLILAGVSINLILGNNGLFNKTKISANVSKQKNALEELQTKVMEAHVEKGDNATLQDLKNILKEDKRNTYVIKYDDKEISPEEDVDLTGVTSYQIIYKNYIFNVDEKLNISFDSDVNKEEQNDDIVIDELIAFEFNYTGDVQEFTVPQTGYYTMECTGASGGYSLCNGSKGVRGGYGGYTFGQIYLTKGDKFYIYVGGKGENGIYKRDSVGGYNGGGLGTWDHNDDECAGAGGGATDIRLVDGDWNNFDSLKSRIMVAGGGAGASWNTCGGDAGGLSGSTNRKKAEPGTQTTGYKFGCGQDGYGSGDGNGVGGAGSGYYGGKTSNYPDNQEAGAGGSSYISGFEGCNSIDKNSTEDNIVHTENNIHYSNKYFTNSRMATGIGSDNGKCVITYITDQDIDKAVVPLYKVCQVGDFVNYDAGTWDTTSTLNTGVQYSFEYNQGANRNASVYTSNVAGGWKIFKIDGDKVYLISVGTPIKMWWGANVGNPQECYASAKTLTEKFINKYAESSRNVLVSDKSDLSNSGTLAIGTEYWIMDASRTDCADTITAGGGTDYFYRTGHTCGMRVILVLKNDVKTKFVKVNDNFNNSCWDLKQ